MKSRLVVSLCHFCEVHGPVVLLSTQIMHYDAFIKLEEDITLASENNNTKQISCEVSILIFLDIVEYSFFSLFEIT